MNSLYTTRELVDAYAALGIKQGDAVYVTGNFGMLGFHEQRSKVATLHAHLEALQTVLGRQGTLVVPTHSFRLCNTDDVFDPFETASERGAFTELVRKQPGAVRQFHPFASLTALGADAQAVCGACTRHAYGPNTPYDRLLTMNAWGVSVGLPPEKTCSVIHHMEQVMAVPYRYTKEFLHPVRVAGEVRRELFYLFVTYRQCELARDRNRKLFSDPELANRCSTARVGIGRISCYPMAVLARTAMRLMSEDVYHWLEHPPETRPYRE